VKQSRTVSALLAMGFVFGLGCGSEAGVAAEDALPLDETTLVEAADVDAVQAGGDIGASEQALTMPVVQPGGTGQQCVAACTRVSAVDLTGQCCVCNGGVKKFARGPSSSLYLCK